MKYSYIGSHHYRHSLHSWWIPMEQQKTFWSARAQRPCINHSLCVVERDMLSDWHAQRNSLPSSSSSSLVVGCALGVCKKSAVDKKNPTVQEKPVKRCPKFKLTFPEIEEELQLLDRPVIDDGGKEKKMGHRRRAFLLCAYWKVFHQRTHCWKGASLQKF